jgi:hypothetical protein
MRASRVLLLLTLGLLGATGIGSAASPTTPRERVDFHLRHVEQLTGHFDGVMTQSCPRFPSRSAWETYIDGETDRLVLLIAHLEQAWIEAKRTPDDDIRRAAKAPRRQADQMQQLLTKLQSCAELNGASLVPGALWRRVEREVPRRQADIALPQ